MSFKFPKAAESFFRVILPRFDTKFDAYYYCLIVGLAAGRIGSPVDVGEEFVRDYVQDFQPYSDLIAGLLIDAEIRRTKVNVDDPRSVEREIMRLLEPGSSTKLRNDGMDLLNQYAVGGFNILSDAFATPPQSLEDFLVTYYSQVWINHVQVAGN